MNTSLGQNDPILSQYKDPNFSQSLAFRVDLLRKLAIRKWENDYGSQMDAISRDSKIEETFIGILKLYRLRRIVSDLIDGRSPSINVVVKENPYEKDEVDKVIEELKSILKLAKDQLKRHNSRLYFVHLPEPARFCDFFVKKTQYCYKSRALPYHENIVSAVRQMGVPVLDITSRFQREKNPARFFYHPRSHLSPTGYRFVAKAMNDAIKQSYAD